jgi:hypothetical protein
VTGGRPRLHVCVGAALLAPARLLAADWSVQSSAQLYALAERNPQLLAGEDRDVQGGVAALAIGLLRQTELLDLHLDVNGSARRYGNDTALDRDDQSVALSLARRGERYVLQGTASVTRDSTLTSELGTTGITEFNQRHRARVLSLAPQWQLTERLATGLSLGWQDNSYGLNSQSRLSNYSYSSAAFNASFATTETTDATLVISGGRLDSALNDFNTHSLAARLELQHSWSPRWQGSLSGGPSKVETRQRTTRGSVFSAAITRKGERLNLDTSLERSIEPTGSGLLSRRDSVGLHANAALSAQVNLGVGLNMIRSRELLHERSLTINDVRYTRAELSLSWRVAREWNLGFTAGNSRQKSLETGAIGKGFDARLMLAWQRQDLG